VRAWALCSPGQPSGSALQAKQRAPCQGGRMAATATSKTSHAAAGGLQCSFTVAAGAQNNLFSSEHLLQQHSWSQLDIHAHKDAHIPLEFLLLHITSLVHPWLHHC
jgi:hypothetical protein